MSQSFHCSYSSGVALLLADLGKALAAVHGTVGLGLEGNLRLAAAHGANSGEELAGTTSRILAGVTAGLAALGLVLEAALRVELLLAGGENELLAAPLAPSDFVFKHFVPSLLMILAFRLYCAQLLLISPRNGCLASLRRIRCTALSTAFSVRPTASAICR